MQRLIKRLRKMILLLAIAILLLGNMALAARCVGVSVDLDLGSHPVSSAGSFNRLNHSLLSRSTLRCNFSAKPNAHKTAVSVWADGDGYFRHESNHDLAIPFELYVDQNFRQRINYREEIEYDMSYIYGWAGHSQIIEMPVFLRIPPFDTSGLRGGAYRANIMLRWEWSVCDWTTILDICGAYDTGEVYESMNLMVNLESECLIRANNINFGTQAFIQEFDPVSGTITIACTEGEQYSVGISEGEHADGSGRRMKSDNHYLAYDIYKGNGQSGEVWGQTGSFRKDSTDADIRPGAALGLNLSTGSQIYQYQAKILVGQVYQYQAKILEGQDDQPAGTYIDHVIIDVNF